MMNIVFIKEWVFVLISTLLATFALGQTTQQDHHSPLTLGQQVSDRDLGKILRYKNNTARLGDFGDKVIIFDFFATWCVPCVAEFPRLDSLKKMFGDQLQIILVTYEDEEKVKTFFKTNRYAASVDLPVIVEDKYLKNLFPHKVVPHDVWIKKGIVKAITSPMYITSTNISKLLREGDLSLPIKSEDMNYTTDKPLFYRGNGGDPRNILFRSTLTKYISGLSGGQLFSIDSSQKTIRVNMIERSIYNLCKFAMEENGLNYFPDNSIRIVASNPQTIKLGKQDYEKWKWENCYNYELQTPLLSKKEISKLMLDDIRRYFNVVPSLEKETIDTYVLNCDSLKAKKAISKGGNTDNNFYEKDGKGKYMINESLSSLLFRLNNLSAVPIIDESSFKHKVDMSGLPVNLGDIDALNKSLAKYGFSLIPAKREIELFYIRDAGANK